MLIYIPHQVYCNTPLLGSLAPPQLQGTCSECKATHFVVSRARLVFLDKILARETTHFVGGYIYYGSEPLISSGRQILCMYSVISCYSCCLVVVVVVLLMFIVQLNLTCKKKCIACLIPNLKIGWLGTRL